MNRNWITFGGVNIDKPPATRAGENSTIATHGRPSDDEKPGQSGQADNPGRHRPTEDHAGAIPKADPNVHKRILSIPCDEKLIVGVFASMWTGKIATDLKARTYLRVTRLIRLLASGPSSSTINCPAPM